MLTVFERIPDAFAQMYDAQFQTWGREFRTRGRRCAIVFDRPPGAPVLLDAEGRPIMKGVWLEAEVDRKPDGSMAVIIRPVDAHAEELILRHCHEMARYRLN